MGLILLEEMIIGIVENEFAIHGAAGFEEEEEDDDDEDELESVVVPAAVVQVPAEMVSVVVETVPPKAKALPVQLMVLPIVIPEASIMVPAKVEFAPSVVAADGVQKISQVDAPPATLTTELETEVRAPFILKI